MSLQIHKDHIQGRENAPVELLEYADYQCSYCGQAYYIIKRVQKELGDNLKFIFRNFPLQQIHPYAVNAAIAAEAAANQGKFWEMHDILFENQGDLDDSHLFAYARKIGLDIHQFEESFNDESSFLKVKKDYETGIKSGVEGTPTFFINGKKFEGNWHDPDFSEYLQLAGNKAFRQ